MNFAHLKSNNRTPLIIALEYALILVLALVATGLNRIGYQGFEDDTNYLIAAHGWLQGFPYIADNHWQIRQPLILTIASSMALLGESEFSVSLGASLFHIAMTAVLVSVVKLLIDSTTALVFGVLIATSPLLVIYATTLYPETYELFFVMAGLALFLMVAENKLNGSAAPLIVAGILFGLAFLTRETSSAVLVFLMVLFLAGYGPPRWHYWWMACGFLLVVIGEAIFYWHYTGDFFYRYLLDAGHTQIFSSHLKGGVYEGSPLFSIKLMSRWVSDSPFPVHWFIDPFVSFFINPAYGGIFLLAIPMLVILLNSKNIDNKVKKALKFSGLLSIIWFIFAVYVLALRPQARYFLPLIIVATLLVSVYISKCLVSSRHILGAVLVSSIVLINMNLIDLRQVPRYKEKLLSSAAKHYIEPIYANADLIKSASMFLGNDERFRLRPLPAPEGALVFMQTATTGPAIGENIDVVKGPRPLSLRLISNLPLIGGKISRYLHTAYPEFCIVRSIQ